MRASVGRSVGLDRSADEGLGRQVGRGLGGLDRSADEGPRWAGRSGTWWARSQCRPMAAPVGRAVGSIAVPMRGSVGRSVGLDRSADEGVGRQVLGCSADGGLGRQVGRGLGGLDRSANGGLGGQVGRGLEELDRSADRGPR